MARSSPGVERTISILSFLAEHPGQAFTLTDFVNALKINGATCHAALNSLVEANFLYRTSAKTYVLGPALFAVAKAAGDHMSPLQIAQPEMRQIADEYDAVCEASMRDGYEVIVRARAEARPQFNTSRPLGTRSLLRPPFGAGHLAWSSPTYVERWLANADPEPTSEQRDVMTRGMAFAREHGYSFNVKNEMFVDKPWDAPELLFSRHRTEFALSLKTDIHMDEYYEGVTISAPVFEAENEVAFVIGVYGLEGRLRGSRVEQIGLRLRTACDRISKFIRRTA